MAIDTEKSSKSNFIEANVYTSDLDKRKVEDLPVAVEIEFEKDVINDVSHTKEKQGKKKN